MLCRQCRHDFFLENLFTKTIFVRGIFGAHAHPLLHNPVVFRFAFSSPCIIVSHAAGYNEPMDMIAEARDYFDRVGKALLGIELHQVWKAMELLGRQGDAGNIVWVVGNGGSAATAAHFANDLIKMARLRAVALTEMVPVITAYGNDDGWGQMFAHPLKVLMGPGDVLVAISCSGKSENVLACARRVAMDRLIVLTGPSTAENELIRLPCYAKLCVASDDIRVVEDGHSAICHALAGMLRGEK